MGVKSNDFTNEDLPLVVAQLEWAYIPVYCFLFLVSYFLLFCFLIFVLLIFLFCFLFIVLCLAPVIED